MMEQYNVTGMSCAACSARVEKAVSAVPGVSSCSVSLLTNSMGVTGSASAADIIRAVENAGYGASKKGAKADDADDDALRDRETPALIKRLIASVILLLPLMYISMGHTMWGLPLPAALDGNHAGMGMVEMLIAGLVMVINQKFFISGFKGAINRAPNMDTLVAMGAGISFLWSVYVLLGITVSAAHGDMAAAEHGMMNLYFESAAMILTLITVGKTLEARSKGKTTNALKELMKLTPDTAVIERDGSEITVPVAEVAEGDIFIVRPGESVPVDGVVISGSSAVNEAALTGESIPVDKAEGDNVSAATINTSGYLRCRATRVGEDTTLSQIIKMVSDAAATKAPIARLADRVSGIFVPAVIAVAAITLVIWLVCGAEIGYALARAISVLVISCPCALGLATPVSIMVANGVGARNGILFKTAVSLEETGRADIVVLDKTGTITTGEPAVTDIIPVGDMAELLTAAAALEAKSEHPLSGAVMKYAAENGIAAREVTDFEALPGKGLTARLDGAELCGGNRKYIETKAELTEEIAAAADAIAAQGKTPLYFSLGGSLLGVIAVADVIKPDSAQAVSELKGMGMRVVMLTGDNAATAAEIGAAAGVDEVIADVLPDGKEAVIQRLSRTGRVIMIGDGINDAPALTRADIGMAIGAGTDVAIDAADVVLTRGSLLDAAAAVRLSRACLKNIHENLFWAFIYNVIGIPLAAGAFIRLTGWELQPMFGAAAMSLSSFCVVTNALRLNLVDVHNARRDRAKKGSRAAARMQTAGTQTAGTVLLSDRSDNRTVPLSAAPLSAGEQSITLHIEGMMCPHCEATVKGCIEQFPEVSRAEVSHEKGTAEVFYTGELKSLDEMKKAIEEEDYKVISII